MNSRLQASNKMKNTVKYNKNKKEIQEKRKIILIKTLSDISKQNTISIKDINAPDCIGSRNTSG
jgi:hypothetical protein